MSVAKDEIGEYSIATSFRGKQRIYHDKKWRRPATVSEMLRQIEATRLGTEWDWRDIALNCHDLKLPIPMKEVEKEIDGEICLVILPDSGKFTPNHLRAYAPEQLQMILDDFEREGMILYEKET